MADNTSIPIIVQGNSFSLAIPLQIYVIDDNEMVLEDYTPDPTDEVTIQLKGSRRNYTYTPTIEGNIANIDLGGYELADNYAVVVTIVKQDGKRLRSFRTDQFFIVESSDDLTQDDIIAGLEENVIYLNAQAFIAGADGRGIEGIQKTGTSGLVDTYTIYYTDNTTSTFQVTNGANGQAGAQGVGITSIEKTGTSGLVDTYTITLSNGQTSTFEVTNGRDGHDLGLAVIVDDLTTGGHEDALSAEMGKELKDIIDGKIRLVTQGYYDELTKVNNVLYLIDNEDGESGSPLPSGYKQLTSISNPNTQKLDTGIVCNGRNYKFQFSFTLQSVVASAKIFSDSTSGGKMWYFGVRGGATMFFFCANNSYAGALNMQPTTSTDYVVSSNMGAITINETSFNVDNTSQTTANRNTIHLFAEPDGSNPCVATIYSFKILDTSDNLLFDGVPAQERATGNVGLYDLVSQTFKVLG